MNASPADVKPQGGFGRGNGAGLEAAILSVLMRRICKHYGDEIWDGKSEWGCRIHGSEGCFIVENLWLPTCFETAMQVPMPSQLCI